MKSIAASHRPAALCLLELNKILFPSPHFLGFKIVIVLTITALFPKVNCVFWQLFKKFRIFFSPIFTNPQDFDQFCFTFGNRSFFLPLSALRRTHRRRKENFIMLSIIFIHRCFPVFPPARRASRRRSAPPVCQIPKVR